MAGNTKALRLRIKSVSSTLQLTKAMELVASSKIRRANERMFAGRQYKEALEGAMDLFWTSHECQDSPFFRSDASLPTRLIVIAGDRGLAGGYNANVFRLAREFENAEFIPIGKRACDRFGSPFVSSENFDFSQANELSDTLCREFLEGRFSRLGILYTKYRSVISQEASVCWLLPFESKEDPAAAGTLFEPNAESILYHAVREYVAGMIAVCVKESFASEVTARRMAMDSAGKNAREMIEELQLQYNRARQGAITQEITEIVAGSGSE